MKIYIEEYNVMNIINKLNSYECKTFNIIEIYSEEGIFVINSNFEMEKYNIIESKIDYININHGNKVYNGVIDYTKINYERWYQIPFLHEKYQISVNEYDITDNLKFVIKYKMGEDDVHDFYFEVKEDKKDNEEKDFDICCINEFLNRIN
jgi:hypothetical protein